MLKSIFKNKSSYSIFAVLALLSNPLFAHTGHGDHTAIYAAGESHPLIGNEHLLVISLVMALVYAALRFIRK